MSDMNDISVKGIQNLFFKQVRDRCVSIKNKPKTLRYAYGA